MRLETPLLALCTLLGACTAPDNQREAAAATSPGKTETAPAPTAAATSAEAATSAAPSSSFVAPSLVGVPPSASSSALANAVAVTEPAPPEPCPKDMVLVGRFCVDRFEGYLKEVLPDGSTKTHPYFDRPVKGVTYQAANELGAFPQAYISRVESKAACTAAGKRLCSRGEWQRACRGKGWSNYPYGQQGRRDSCNSGKLHLLTKLFKHPAQGFKYEDHFNSPELNKTPGFLSKSGEYDKCVADVGTYDMVGNLHEWVSDTVDDEFFEKMGEENVDRQDQPWRVGNGVFMGGFYSTTSEHGPGCTFTTIAHEPAYHDYSTGFRCCKAADLPKPEPKPKPGTKTAAKPSAAPKVAPAPSSSASAKPQ